jgi:lipoprotein-releasing system ATP-binding protein
MADETAEPSQHEPVLELRDVHKSYGKHVVTEVLHGIDLRLNQGEFAALIGPSGSGKSTLLNQIGLLDRPTSGRVRVLGHDTGSLSDEELTRLRGRTLGFVFQFHHLIGALTAEQNLILPLALSEGGFRPEHHERALEALDQVGLKNRADARPDQLSGGQQQRVAIARALIHRPDLVLADEPTGNLDSKTADDIFSLLRDFNRRLGTTLLVVTHDPRMAARCDRVITIEDGRITHDEATTPV